MITEYSQEFKESILQNFFPIQVDL